MILMIFFSVQTTFSVLLSHLVIFIESQACCFGNYELREMGF